MLISTVLTMNGFRARNRENRIAYLSSLNHRISAKSMIRSGIGADVFMVNVYNAWDNVIVTNYSGNSTLLKGFAQWQYRFGSGFTFTPGVYGQYYTLSGDYSVEPRLGLRWELSPATSFSVGGGLHSQLQPRLAQMFADNGVLPNENMEMSKSWQNVVGFNQKLGDGMRLKTEVYYQHLYNIPVIPAVPAQSIVNLGDDFFTLWDFAFVNEGTGRNYGVEMTLEKFFARQYYFLLTASLFDSKYKGFDGIERRTRFAGNYAFNGLFGYEWKVGRRSLLSVNTKASFVGGKRYIPTSWDVIGDGNIGDLMPQFDYSLAYVNRLPDYFRWDVNMNVKTNYQRFSLEWVIEVNNLTNHKNVLGKNYDVQRERYEYFYQYGFMPAGGVKVYF